MKRYTLLTLILLTLNTPMAFAEEEMAGHTMPMPAAKTVTPPPASSTSETAAVTLPASTATADNMQNLLLMMQEIVKMMSSITERLNLMSATTPMTMPSSTGMVMSPLQARKQEMLTLMQKIQQTSDPATRQKLLQEHQAKMQDVMNMLNGMMESQMQMTGSASQDMAMKDDMKMDDMKMDDMKMMKDDMKMMKGDMMGGGKKGEMKRHKLMEQRLNDMQELLNQMLQHQAQTTK